MPLTGCLLDEKPESLQKWVAKNQKIPVFFPDSREIGDEFAADCLHRQIKDLGRLVTLAKVAKSRFATELLPNCYGLSQNERLWRHDARNLPPLLFGQAGCLQ